MKERLKAIADGILASDNNILLTFRIDAEQSASARKLYNKCREYQNSKKKAALLLKIEEWHNPRTLSQNAAMWLMLEQMAEKLKTSKDELYIDMLDQYGKFTHIIVKPEAVEAVKKEWRTVRDLGEVTVNGKNGVQLQCYFGSSGYNTVEMSRLFEGVLHEARELEIDVSYFEGAL